MAGPPPSPTEPPDVDVDEVEVPARSGLAVPTAVVVGMLALALFQQALAPFFDRPGLQTWSTVFVSITVQALPFLTLGVVVSGLLAAYLPRDLAARIMPNNPALAVPAAGVAGVALPGCECGSVPIAGRLVARGASPAPALTFLLAAPAINPIVIASTVVAFPGQPEVALARFVASLLTAVIVGWMWLRVGRNDFVERLRSEPESTASRWVVFRSTTIHDLLHAGGYLVLGAGVAATLRVVVPASVVDAVGGSGVLAVLTMAALAVVLSICSEADAFVAVGLTQFSLTSRLVFLVVGPVVDLKLIALQVGTFGRPMVARFAPLCLVTAIVCAVLVGTVLL
ncbi:MAG: permease [Actinomycetota bacterium]